MNYLAAFQYAGLGFLVFIWYLGLLGMAGTGKILYPVSYLFGSGIIALFITGLLHG